jgi:hypothetical protein
MHCHPRSPPVLLAEQQLLLGISLSYPHVAGDVSTYSYYIIMNHFAAYSNQPQVLLVETQKPPTSHEVLAE